ncbi:hypothetical protein EAX61_14060 [Dokdonia sinensis]|uniref:Uncharacterized protein n=1 Tax=Dokdonia sinensis TaxID=2479847 RepID=A0A3M0G5Z3_9FLAO|nr:hypothetical protein [Dokdonia sinensis]RMB56529.1 hypothetical protein EAX61_14060 [Dokdonia sinensis]
MLLKIAALGMAVLLLCSCKEESCYKSQHNEVLGANQYNTKVYQAELYRLIKESSEVDYYFETREEIMGQIFLVVNAYGDAFCGKLCLVISEEDAQQMHLDENKGYRGAQLIGLRFRESKTDYGATLVYEALEYIVD